LTLFSIVRGKRGSHQVIEPLAQFQESNLLVVGRLKKFIGITDRETVQGFKDLWINPATVGVTEKKNAVDRTVVELDLESFSDIARRLEEHFSARIVLEFEAQIQSFVDDGLKAVGIRREDAVMADTGDGAIVAFEHPKIAHRFAEAVYRSSSAHNRSKTYLWARRRFRIGIATGDLAIDNREAVRKIAGDVISRAVRLEARARVGEIVIDTATYERMPRSLQRKYGPARLIRGKREERFRAHRLVVIPEIEY
jgi:class 3 adenylate cyclase